MVINRALVSSGLYRKPTSFVKVVKIPVANIYNRMLIGNRDWVAFGRTGAATYDDHLICPFPAVRFKENCNELLALREKEKGDWRKLTIDEKKILYRASFRLTLTEWRAPTGQWKSITGCCLILLSIGLWIFYFIKFCVCKPLPDTFNEEKRRNILRRMLVSRYGYATGVSAKWDYELDDWKK
ncbi:hypothetical protein RUM43_014870 [Polyplax serrata]|uniref:Cytochrome c oxidase subunit 4 n=1 Tax=Polyplax serrata TaxID=468196 RepID=A0AAN8PSL5_POLSC